MAKAHFTVHIIFSPDLKPLFACCKTVLFIFSSVSTLGIGSIVAKLQFDITCIQLVQDYST